MIKLIVSERYISELHKTEVSPQDTKLKGHKSKSTRSFTYVSYAVIPNFSIVEVIPKKEAAFLWPVDFNQSSPLQN